MSKTDAGGVPLVIFHTAKREPAEVHKVLDAASFGTADSPLPVGGGGGT